MSNPRVLTAAERADVWSRAEDLDEEVWPEYNRHGDVLNRYWGRLDEDFAEFQFVLYDEESDELLAQGHTIPFPWDGTADGLPAGIDGVVVEAFDTLAEGRRPTALSALAIEIPPERQRGGLSSLMLAGMRDIAAAHGLADLAAPLRPTWKERYPLTPIDRYAAWTREDGLPFDPWIRLHVRLGGQILAAEPRSLRITGTVAEWEEWTAMRFPESGAYVFPHGLAPLEIDREADLGSYWEPNVWVRHPVA
jgi:hypothetical protein